MSGRYGRVEMGGPNTASSAKASENRWPNGSIEQGLPLLIANKCA